MQQLNECDRKWIDAIRRYWGDGSAMVPVPTWKLPDGSVDAVQTLDWLMHAYKIAPKTP